MADPYDSELEWWFNCGDALLGEKGNLSSTISALERGGANIGVFTDPKEDWDQLAWHQHHEQMARERKLRARFLTLLKVDQAVLVAYYGTSVLKQPHMAARFGKYAAVIEFMAWWSTKMKGMARAVDLRDLTLKEVKTYEAGAKTAVLEAHRAWRATKPKKEKRVDFQVPLPIAV